MHFVLNHLKNLPFLAIAGVSLLGFGCGPSDKSSKLANAVSAEVLSGTWGKLAKVNSSASAMGIESKTTIFRYGLVTLQVQGESVQVADRPCDIQSESTGGSSISFPQALINSLPEREYSYQLQGSQLTLQNGVEILGAKLANPLTDPMPSSKDEPTVFDTDNDGNPGISVEVRAKALITIKGTMYIAQRQIWNEQLDLLAPDTIKGKLVWQQEQKILGSSNRILSSVVPNVTALDSFITLKKLADNTTCDDLKQQKDVLLNAP